MLPKLGKTIAKPRYFQLKTLIQGTLINRAASLTPCKYFVYRLRFCFFDFPLALATRSFSIGTINTLQQDELITKITASTIPKPVMTEASVFETLDEFKSTGNLKSAIKTVQNARDLGIATPAIYLYLVDMLRDLPFDIDNCATVASWFYSESTKLPLDVMENMDVWKSVLKLGFRFGATYRAEDLRALVDKFTEIFDLTTLNDQNAWELLMRVST